jgi:GTPase SAR1 family protein
LGDAGVGKTQFFNQWHLGKPLEHTVATVGVDFKAKTYNCNGEIVTVQLWDTGIPFLYGN